MSCMHANNYYGGQGKREMVRREKKGIREDHMSFGL